MEGVSGGLQGVVSFQYHLSGEGSELQNTEETGRPGKSSSTASSSQSRSCQWFGLHFRVISTNACVQNGSSHFWGVQNSWWKLRNKIRFYLYKCQEDGELKCQGRVCCCSSHRAIAECGSAACSAAWGATERDRELCHSPFQPNPGKKSLIPAILTILPVCFPFIFVIITRTSLVEFTIVCRYR